MSKTFVDHIHRRIDIWHLFAYFSGFYNLTIRRAALSQRRVCRTRHLLARLPSQAESGPPHARRQRCSDVFIGGSMAYMLLIVEPVDQRDERGEVAGREVFAEMVRYRDTLNERGVLISAESLATAKKGKRLQVHDGKARVVDG